ncbi:MAG TPA: ABC transporter ATP-binding protein [Xanthobacteraceae bacterium]|jgi:peptide/nickel transport system ATP-binding protein|nr:ABC transporter ATP-binding protein [Xanthobacteraceae bacterium]
MAATQTLSRIDLEAAPLVDVENLDVTFHRDGRAIPVVRDLSFSLRAGKVLCIIGESGSGKSVTLRAVMRLLGKSAQLDGRIELAGHDMLALPERKLAKLRGALVAMIFQEPMTAFDPVYTIGHQIGETLRRHMGMDARRARMRAEELLDLVQIPRAKARLDAYPHELSGGLRQRAMIALALSCRPALLLADEPTTALDATVQIQILLLLRSLQRELGMAMIFVTHDLSVAAEISDDVAVMYAGRFVETGPVTDVLRRPRHPYTAGLMASSVGDKPPGVHLDVIQGQPPDPASILPGCSFAPRCAHASETCLAGLPPELWITPDHAARCIRAISS